jgi:hypothetical protein
MARHRLCGGNRGEARRWQLTEGGQEVEHVDDKQWGGHLL